MLTIPRDISEQIRRDAHAAFPEECCGILLGRVVEPDRREVLAAIPCRNAHPQPGMHYSIAADELIEAQRDARDRHFAIVGFYHSHPSQPAEASSTDQADAYWKGCSYLILGVNEGGLEMESHVCAAEQILVPEPLEII